MPTRFRLENGLTVVFEQQRATHVAAFQVWVNVGSADERLDQAGLAHLHEHMLFKGTAHRGPGEIARDIEAHGGEVNAWTSFDQTVYHTVIASQFARKGLDVLGDAVRFSSFDPGELSREIEVVCEEIKRSLDSPSRRSSRELFANAYQVHPYQRPVIGWEETVRSFTREKVLDFYNTHYAPRNMVLTAVGDLDENELRQWAEEIFGGDWGRGHTPPPPRPVEPPWSSRRIALKADSAKEAFLNIAFQIPSSSHADTPALDLLAMVVGQGDASRMALEIKRKLQLVNEIHASAYTPKDPGLFVTSMTLQPEKLEAAIEAALRLIAQLKTSPVDEGELATVKAIVEADAVYQRETVQGLARKLGYYELAMGGLEAEARYYEQIARATPQDLQQAAQRYFHFDKAIVSALLPAGSALTAERVEEIFERVSRETPRAPAVRDIPAPAAASPLRITAPLAAKKAAGGIIVERLSSGAQVIIREEAAVPLFAMRAVFVGGVRFETEANNGLSALLGRTLARGTQSRSAEQVSHLIDDLAGSLGASAGRNSINLRGEFLSKHFEPAFDLFAEVLTAPAFTESEIDREKLLLLQDIATREDKPSGVAFDLLAKALYPTHPYRLSVHGEGPSVERLGAADLRDYHQKWMDPSQLTLAVVGDVKADRVLALAEQWFGKSRGGVAPHPTLGEDQLLTAPQVTRKTLQRAQSHLVLGFRGAKVTDGWRRSLEVLSTILSGQGGRLFVELRDKRSMAYSVSSFAVEGLEPGHFAVYIGTSPEKVDAALEGIRAELAKIRDEKVTDKELDRARRNLIGTHEIGLQRNGARAAVLGLDHAYGLGLTSFQHYTDQIAAVTADDVRDAAQRVIVFERSALAHVGP